MILCGEVIPKFGCYPSLFTIFNFILLHGEKILIGGGEVGLTPSLVMMTVFHFSPPGCPIAPLVGDILIGRGYLFVFIIM